MEIRRWQTTLIIAVIALTLYNILPTLFYYAKPLKQPIDAKMAEAIIERIEDRVGQLHTDAAQWLKSYCDLIGTKPREVVQESDGRFALQFSSASEANQIKEKLPRAGALISFAPSQLWVDPSFGDEKCVVVHERLGAKLTDQTLQFTTNTASSELFRKVIWARASEIASLLTQEPCTVDSDTYTLGKKNDHFFRLSVNWDQRNITLSVKPGTDLNAQAFIDTLANLRFVCNEVVNQEGTVFKIPFDTHPDTTGYLVLDLEKWAASEQRRLIHSLKADWRPTHFDLSSMPIVSPTDYEALTST
ncbi:MAG: bifunctional preprotein translocase subunit SecD/SecF, partial [Chlamydiota bacterium]